MRPSKLGLVVYRHHILDEENEQWLKGGVTLSIPDNADLTRNRYEPTEALTDDVNGVVVYLFNNLSDRTAFLAGLYSSGDELSECAAGMTNLGCQGVIREFRDPETFVRCARKEDRSHVVVFDYRFEKHEQVMVKETIQPFVFIQHRNSKIYGGRIAASPEYSLVIDDQRKEAGEACMVFCPPRDESGDGMLHLSAVLDTLPGGSRTVPHVQIHHFKNRQRLFSLYRHSTLEYLLFPESGVKFVPHLMPNGTMGFKVASERFD